MGEGEGFGIEEGPEGGAVEDAEGLHTRTGEIKDPGGTHAGDGGEHRTSRL